jgi:thiol-disulfide isomerase/thioredoxin
MFAVAPLLFWAWLNNESPIYSKETKDKAEVVKATESKKSKSITKKMPADKAMEIMLEHGFLPQLSAVYVPALIINVQTSSTKHFHGINYKDSKKPVLLHFWATWCGPCKQELPFFAAFVNAQDTMDVYTITSELKDSDTSAAAQIWNFYSAHNIKGLNVCTDFHNKLASLFDVSGIPATILISANGQLLGRFLGATDWANPELAAALVSYLG